MDRKRSNWRVQIDSSQLPKYDSAEDDPSEALNQNDYEDEMGENGMRLRTG
ncbi:hypothetical protein HS088_TW08G00063 [Tripterygium wilfordii]|uniref:Uncharacterized protein n=1 Tax=Tripterygium wilfordii TaxID=458696 RepID=A0A7J7DB43_TRIWF|nr:hypothetical protein HS088_TW08G00063 [Tripterygium wilfordii]